MTDIDDITPDRSAATIISDLEVAERRLDIIHGREGDIISELGVKVAEVVKVGKQLRDAEVELERCQAFHSQIVKVLDDVDRAVSAAIAEADPTPFGKGLLLIRENFLTALRGAGIERIPIKKGASFDPAAHEAVAVDGDEPKGTIVYVSAHGYMYATGLFAGRLVRAAQVVVGGRELPAEPPPALAQGVT